MKSPNAAGVHEIVEPWFRIAQFLGVHPHDAKKSNRKRIACIDHVRILYTLIFTSTVYAFSLVELYVLIFENFIKAHQVIVIIIYMSNTLSSLVIHFLILKNSKKFVDLLNGFSTVDESFEEINLKLNYSKDKKSTVFFTTSVLILVTVYQTTLLIANYNDLNFRIRPFAIDYFSTVLKNMVMVQISVTMHLVKTRFRLLNDCLIGLKETIKRGVGLNRSIFLNRLSEKITVLRQVHYDLYVLAESINDLLQGSIFLYMAMFIGLTSTNIYHSYAYFHRNLEKYQQINYSSLAFDVFSSVNETLILIVFWFYGRAIEEANRTGYLVQKVLMYKTKDCLKNQLEEFGRNLLNYKLNLTAYGLFTLDFPLTLSTIGTISQYLVILIQFYHQSLKNKEELAIKNYRSLLAAIAGDFTDKFTDSLKTNST